MPRLPEFETPVADHCAVSMAAAVVAAWAGLVAAALADRAALGAADFALALVDRGDPQPTGWSTVSLARDVLPRTTCAQTTAKRALAALARATWEVC